MPDSLSFLLTHGEVQVQEEAKVLGVGDGWVFITSMETFKHINYSSPEMIALQIL